MSTELFVLFETKDGAKQAERELLKAGFSHGEIQIKDSDQQVEGSKLDGLRGSRRLLIFTAPDPNDRERARQILQANGATNIGDRPARYHANRLIPDPDYSEESLAS